MLHYYSVVLAIRTGDGINEHLWQGSATFVTLRDTSWVLSVTKGNQFDILVEKKNKLVLTFELE